VSKDYSIHSRSETGNGANRRDWKSGDRLWVVEVIAPFGGAEAMVQDLKAKVFPQREGEVSGGGGGGAGGGGIMSVVPHTNSQERCFWVPDMRLIKMIVAVSVACLLLITVYSAIDKHLRTACYSPSAITSETKAIEAAKDLIIKNQIFSFPDVGSSEDFIRNLEGTENCCEAREYFSFIYLASVWKVALVSKEYFTIMEMDECGKKLLYRGSSAN
jgi:RTX toxin acyltransferase family